MKTDWSVICLLMLAAVAAVAAPLKIAGNTTLTVKQVIPGEGILAEVQGTNIRGEVIAESGEIFIGCNTQGISDNQVVKPAPAIYTTSETYSFTAVSGAVRTLPKYKLTP